MLMIFLVENTANSTQSDCTKPEASSMKPETSEGAPVKAEGDSDAEKMSDELREELEVLFSFVAKVFLTNFPIYRAYKCLVPNTIDDINPKEVNALQTYCEMTARHVLFPPPTHSLSVLTT